MTLYIATSVDGFIATDDGGVAWLEEFEQDGGGESAADGFADFFATVDCLLVGAKTYDQVLGFGEWPYGRTPTYVVTGRDLPCAHDDVELVDGDVSGLVDRLKGQYEHVWLVGGGQLARTVLRSDRVDRLHLTLAPVLLGSGIPLFGETGQPAELRLLDADVHESGLIEVRYAVEP